MTSISGGLRSLADGDLSWLGGGENNDAFGFAAAVSGGTGNVANGRASSVSGGLNNGATGYASSVSGGWYRQAPVDGNWAAGGLSSPPASKTTGHGMPELCTNFWTAAFSLSRLTPMISNPFE